MKAAIAACIAAFTIVLMVGVAPAWAQPKTDIVVLRDDGPQPRFRDWSSLLQTWERPHQADLIVQRQGGE